MQLLDLSDHLPGLPRLPGLKKWYARGRTQYYNTWEEASQVCTACQCIIHHACQSCLTEHLAARGCCSCRMQQMQQVLHRQLCSVPH